MEENSIPNHIAIIMDGNRRWAKERNIETKLGHKEGAENLKRIARYANKRGISYLTVYAFSTENWKRTKEEIGALMILLQKYVEDFLTDDNLDNIRVNVIGDISKLEQGLQKSIQKIVEKSKENTGLTLNIAFNYGGRDEIVKAMQKIGNQIKDGSLQVEDINEDLIENSLYTKGMPEPDLMIRTGGQQRISNFLLWQLAYTEFLFIPKYWPDFTEEDLEKAISSFENRNRNFGGK